MFADINMRRKEDKLGLIVKNDQRVGYSSLVRDIAKELGNIFDIEQPLSRLTHNNDNLTSLTTMRKCLVALFEVCHTKEGQSYYQNIKPPQGTLIYETQKVIGEF